MTNFRIVIGVGTYSVPGEDLERHLNFCSLDDVWIQPIIEIRCPITSAKNVQRQAFAYAEEMRATYDAESYVGVASGICPVQGRAHSRASLARFDFGALCLPHHSKPYSQCLNPHDLQWQMKKRVYGLCSDPEAVQTLSESIREMYKKYLPSATTRHGPA